MPALSKKRKSEEKIFDDIRSPPQHHKSVYGSPFHLNCLVSIIKNEIANPQVMAHLRTMPEDTGKSISEMFNAFKWREDPAVQTPMVSVNGKQFYVEEFAHTRDGATVYIRSFFLKESIAMMKVNRIEPSSGRYYICEDTVVILPISDLRVAGYGNCI